MLGAEFSFEHVDHAVCWLSCPEAGGNSVPRPGIEPALARWVLNHGTTEEAPPLFNGASVWAPDAA